MNVVECGGITPLNYLVLTDISFKNSHLVNLFYVKCNYLNLSLEKTRLSSN